MSVLKALVAMLNTIYSRKLAGNSIRVNYPYHTKGNSYEFITDWTPEKRQRLLNAYRSANPVRAVKPECKST